MIALHFLFLITFGDQTATTPCPGCCNYSIDLAGTSTDFDGVKTMNCDNYVPNTICVARCLTPDYSGDPVSYKCDGTSQDWIPVDGASAIVCTKLTCGTTIADAADAKYTYDCTTTNELNDNCAVRCADGYYGAGNNYVCSSSGQWSGSVPTCTAITCRDVIGFVEISSYAKKQTCSNLAFGATCVAECAQAYEGTSVTYECGGEGQIGDWTVPVIGADLSCTARSCGQQLTESSEVQLFMLTGPSPGYSKVTATNLEAVCGLTVYSSRCIVGCKAGYNGNSADFYCQEDAVNSVGVIWTLSGQPLPTCTPNDCGPRIFGTVFDNIYDYNCVDHTYEDTCQVACKAGFTGNAVDYTCGASGWVSSGAINCAPVTCPAPETVLVDNVALDVACDAENGAICHAGCTAGFYRQEMTLYCVASGIWTTPRNITFCQAITTTENATIIINNVDNSQTIEEEDKGAQWTIFWIVVALGAVALLACCYVVYRAYKDPDRLGLKKGFTIKQNKQMTEKYFTKDQILQLDEFVKLRAMLRKQETKSNVFDGLSSSSNINAIQTSGTSSSAVALEVDGTPKRG